MAKIDITLPQAVIDDFKALEGFEVNEGETDAAYAKRIVLHLVRAKYRDAKHASLWNDAKQFIQGNLDSIV